MFTMQTNEILSASLIDIVFDGRNKDYGAYELRKNYSGRIGRAMLVVSVIVAMAFGGVILGNSVRKPKGPYVMGPEHVIIPIDRPKPKAPEIQKPKKQEVPVKTEKFINIQIVDKPKVDPPPTVDDLSKAIPGTEKRPGADIDSIDVPPVKYPGEDKGIIELPKKSDDPVTLVDVEACFCNGNWKKFLEKNLRAEVPVDNGAPFGTYSVIIQFVVDLDGTVSDIKALTDHGYGMEEEALRVIRKTAKWTPGIYHGFPVKSYRKQVITFQVVEG